MVSSPVQNLSGFLKNNPPLVVFLLCLVALTVSTFYYAFVIEKDEPTVDSDKKHDWISMLKHFNKLDTCINFSTWTNEINVKEEEEQYKNEISVFTKVTVKDIYSLGAFPQVYGTLSLQGWYSTTCQDPEKLPKNVEIFFDVPPLVKNSNVNDSMDLCVTIKGPAEYLPLLKEPSCKPKGSDKISEDKVKGLLSSMLQKISDPKFCADGKLVKMKFDLAEPDVENYLSDDVRTEIYIHLMWCSYILVFIIFCILLCAILKKSEYLEKKEQSARLL